ncbi:MAG: ketoacyl-ACP synthase III [Candidatus Eiseniibacteriota bacterium]|nr:MAG: ketoacyl-ACP synthase III [Candidatus Eisenbacteria bacterium]
MEQIRGARIAGTGSFVPLRVMTNADLEKTVDTSDEWISTRTGIRERHISDDGASTSDLAAEAAKAAMAEAGVAASDIEMIVVGTATPDRLFPSTACRLQEKLGAFNAAAFDVLAACTGFLYGLTVARSVIGSGVVDNVLVVGAETLSKITDWTDRNTCVLFGDGAGAAVVKPCEPGRGILSASMGSDGRLGYLLELPAGGSLHPVTEQTVQNRMHYIKMRGNEVFKNAVRAMGSVAEDALLKAGVKAEQLDLLIPHQANLRIIKATARRLGVDSDKVFVNVHKYGNTSSASVPIALHEARGEGRIKDGDLVELVAFGAGFTWGAAVIRW